MNACADAHDGVTRLIRDGLRYDHFMVPTACRSCRDPLCMTQCPVGSIRRKESLEIIIEDWCIGCTKCAELCPYGNINMHPFEVMKEVPAETPKPAAPAAAAAKPAAAPAKPATPPAEPKPAAPAQPAEVPAAAKAAPAVPAEAPVVAKPAPAPPAAAPAAAKPAPAPAAPAPPKKMVKKKVSVTKATTCDLCTDLSVPSCVYACPHDAAKRVDPAKFFASQDKESGWSFQKKSRTTH